jgi:integrase
MADVRRFELWTRVLGADKDPHLISLGEWERFIDLRSSGTNDSRGRLVPEEKRRRVRDGTVGGDCLWLRWTLNWGTRWRTREGAYLLRHNAVRGYDVPTEKSPRRPVVTRDRFEALRAVSDGVTMEVTCGGRRETARSYLSELLEIAAGTGRRISPVLRLRYLDLRLDRTPEAPYGAICWPAETDKTDRTTTAPITPRVRAAIDRILADRPGVGAGPIFPGGKDPARPISRHIADDWLREAEKLAGLEPQDGSAWHAFRRMWATERKHLPAADVAAVGGWANAATLQRCYQQADSATMLRVVLEAGELREVGGGTAT